MVRMLRSFIAAILAVGAVAALASPTGAEGPRSCTPEERFVHAAYQDFLGRAPDGAGLSYWAGSLQAGYLDRTGVAVQLAHTGEYLGVVVGGLYSTAFDRNPDAAGLAYWVERLRAGARVADLAGDFFASAEFYAARGGTDTGWLRGLYEEILQRPMDASGEQYWLAQLRAGRTRSSVASTIYQSEENRQDRVAELYRRFLERAPDPTGLRFWAAAILTEDDVALGAFLAGSDEYNARAVSVDPGCPSTQPTPPPPPGGTPPPVQGTDMDITSFTVEVTRGGHTFTTYVTHPVASGRYPIILVGHGSQNNGAQAAQNTRFLARRGYVVAAPTMTGRPLAEQPHDLSHVLTVLTSPSSRVSGIVDAERVGMYGTSLGAMAGLLYYNDCCDDGRIDVVVSRMGMASGRSGWLWSTMRMPLLMVHGENDRVVPYAEARSTYAGATGPKAFVTLHGYGHDLAGPQGVLSQDVSLAWFDGHLKADSTMRDRISRIVDGASYASLDWG